MQTTETVLPSKLTPVPVQVLPDGLPNYVRNPAVRIVMAVVVGLLVLVASETVLGLVAGGVPADLVAVPGMEISGELAARILIGALLAAITALGIYWLFVTYVERRSATELSRPGAGREFIVGLCLGVALLGTVVAIVAATGNYSVDGTHPVLGALAILGVSAIAPGFVEEIVFRALGFRILEELLGTWLSLGLTAVIFGGVDLANPNASITAALAIGLEAGVLLGGLYALTRRLWIVFGVHLAWNATQGALFGIAISGTGKDIGLLNSELTGSTWLSGGEFGVEASIFSVALCLAVALPVLIAVERRGRIVRPRWSNQSGGAPILAP